MRRLKFTFLLAGCFFLFGVGKFSSAVANAKDLTATIDTSMGSIEVKLFHKRAPKTVSNFVELARKGFYNNLIFHRVIPKFMIQGGDPEGTGRGGPGYSFEDEFNKELRHSKAGMLSMANSGPNTNGSQFFITVAPTPHLDDKHSIFGEITKGLDVAVKISETKRNSSDKPEKDVVIKSIKINGDWFKPVALKKIQALTKEDLQKLTQKKAELLLKKIAEAQSLGKMLKAKFGRFAARGSMAQVNFDVDFEKSKGAKLILLGEADQNKFDLKQFQFGMGQ
ncbi:MAG: peptidylprolyl isomerase [Bdellovibrionota bacterium]